MSKLRKEIQFLRARLPEKWKVCDGKKLRKAHKLAMGAEVIISKKIKSVGDILGLSSQRVIRVMVSLVERTATAPGALPSVMVKSGRKKMEPKKKKAAPIPKSVAAALFVKTGGLVKCKKMPTASLDATLLTKTQRRRLR